MLIFFIGSSAINLTSPGKFYSPGYPVRYTNRLNYVWNIYSPGNSKIQIVFTEFVTEPRYDFIQIFDYVNYRWIPKERYSGNRLIPRITSSSNRLRVTFTTDGSVTRKGFSAYFFFCKYMKNHLFHIDNLKS